MTEGAAVGFIDSRDGMLAAMIHGVAHYFEGVPAMALTLHVYGYRYLVEPPSEEGWPDWAETDARLYLDVNEELRQIRETVAERQLGQPDIGPSALEALAEPIDPKRQRYTA